ncbi:hypothetical protein C7H84_34740 [Burkholderia sp. Nafp2/4-1b]|uniref:hypothetical protein n=1 Tax=Burkholderia sp. Nafp2/4-1b TaxID=2116686 RepID=UPI000EF8D9AC|nr:hypothetical protein [Burkholderia sp. Nafp2/4-1b]RKT98846.1 hypothetical protein C7H84_34740 [Burkholderia sp. Nafp2/4-1b]
MQWNTIVLPDGMMLADHVYAMAAHGDITALELIKNGCKVPSACSDPVFTPNVLTSLEFQFAGDALPATYVGQLEGPNAERQRAIERATALRRSLLGRSSWNRVSASPDRVRRTISGTVLERELEWRLDVFLSLKG